MDRNGRVFTSQNLTLIREMAARGCSARNIAEAIGSTPASVRVKCSQQKIRLKRGRGPGGRRNVTLAGQRSQFTGVPIIAYLSESIYALLIQRANELHKPPSMLASMLLTEIASSGLYKAVVDD